MARLPVMDIVRSSVEDISAYKGLAAVLYGILLATGLVLEWFSRYLGGHAYPLAFSSPAGVGTLMFRAGLYRFVFATVLPVLLNSFVLAWVYMQWADWVASRTARGSLDRGRYWPSFWALVKYWLVIFAIFAAARLLAAPAQPHTISIFMTHGRVVLLPDTGKRALVAAQAGGGAGAFLGILVDLLGFWMMVRLLLLPARGAIGEDSSIAACWRSTRGTVWSLLSLMLVMSGIAIFAGLICAAVFVVMAYVAVSVGWVAAPASLNLPAILPWLATPAMQKLYLARTILIAPVTGTVFFIFTGSIVRAALLIESFEARSIYARALAAWQTEKSLWQ